MEATIITVYNSENCGSFFQAYALLKVLQDAGAHVKFLKREGSRISHSRMSLITGLLKALILRQAGDVPLISARYKAFERAQKVFETTEDPNGSDIVVIGSDVIWDFECPYFRRNKDRYTGRVTDSKIVFYAPSTGNSGYEEFERGELAGLDRGNVVAVSARDLKTKEFISKQTKCEAEIVCDPVLLLEKDDYIKMAGECKNKPGKYILLYYFGKVPDGARRNIMRFSKEAGAKLVSFGCSRKWCDESVASDPYAFLAYYSGCTHVITNTYHGILFSVIFKKPFAAYAKNKYKVGEFLEKYGLDGQNADFDENIFEKFAHPVPFDAAWEKIDEDTRASMAYLKENVGRRQTAKGKVQT
jgi:hypothetical protein